MVAGGRETDGLLGVVPVGEVTRTAVREYDQADDDAHAADEGTELVTDGGSLENQTNAHYDCG